MDQLRADVYLDLLRGTTTGDSGGSVDIRVDLDTLMGLSDQPGEIAGYGPIIDDIARRVIADNTGGQWRYTVTHQGHPVATGTTHRRPTTGQKRFVEATHPTCVFAGCRMPGTECDIDHRIEWANTHTTITQDLAPFCRHDHVGKHKHGWAYQILPNGDIKWTSPLGHTYTTHNRDP